MAACVLHVDDQGRPGAELTERLGKQLYRRFLAEAPYDELKVLTGTQDRLAETLCELGGRHDAVDVFCSVHTTERDPKRWQEWLPPERRRLRLVYSTACHGADAERAAWEGLEPRTVVTHEGINNPLTQFPLFLSRWLAGDSVGAAVAAAYWEESMVSRFLLSLPGMPSQQTLAEQGWDFVSGSRPVVSGDPNLCLDRQAPACPAALQYDRQTGGPLGLLLRALSGAHLAQRELAPFLDGLDSEWRALVPPLVWNLTAVEAAQAELCLVFSEEETQSLQPGVRLRLQREVGLKPVCLDAAQRRIVCQVRGVDVQIGPARARLDTIQIRPAPTGYALRVTVRLFGLLPWRKSVFIGGGFPQPLPPPLALAQPGA